MGPDVRGEVLARDSSVGENPTYRERCVDVWVLMRTNSARLTLVPCQSHDGTLAHGP